MEKLSFILIAFLALILSIPKVNAQTTMLTANTSALIKNIDTVTNTATKTCTSLVVKGSWHTVTVNTVVTKISGTAAGTLSLYGSLDGVNYSRIRSTLLQGAQVDSLVVTNISTPQVANFVVLNSPFQFYRTSLTGVGTMAAAIFGKYVAH